MQTVDVIVIGTGSAGVSAAEAAREAGKSVAIIDKQPFGGTCSQRGCDPKKVLVGVAEISARSSWMTGKGIDKQPKISWADLMAFKRTFTEPIPDRTVEKFKDEGLKQFHGVATFILADTIRVNDKEIKGKQIVIASGNKPMTLGIPGEELLIDSTGFLDLDELPDEIVLVGGGYIAFEFANVAMRAGAKVTIINDTPRPLGGFDPDLVDLLVKTMEDAGITILVNAAVSGISGKPGKLTVEYKQDGKTQSVKAGLAVHAAGRAPDIDELALDVAGVTVGKKGVVVNDYMQSVSNPAVYACGDVAEKGLPLTPMASYEGKIVGTNLVEGNTTKYEQQPVPTTVYAIPPMASVGLTEAKAKEQGKKVKVIFKDAVSWYTSKRINEPAAGSKILIDSKTDEIVGAHLLGEGSDEVINIFAVAMAHKITASDLTKTIYAYPTRSSDISYMLKE
ncbi:dihydrolipoyl dehydrogenase family protein [Spirosoma rhododendri]|uniref:NAD(P)/FAD-dependent oxidoreductase n=1 Tax=Spirosoma rhododendri TaxID=2728024 RepID=A0A7L5DN94_9BACT|nr:NAD(P)/FAD-dependent oxidoreductase [Spirosoma rhododendri]QJD79929.1 NAD(P)/FAD-dependent oxidoreductase [Spirosoma rhododendri]